MEGPESWMVSGNGHPLSPKVSVVMPFFNAERTLLPAIQSVFAQTWPHWELILLDDGSTDGSLQLARSIADNRVLVISDGVNRGHADRRNQLVAMARGEFVVMLDADDLMHSGRLERQLAVFASCPELDVVATGVASMTSSFRIVGVRELGLPDMSAINVLLRGGIAHSSIMGRRSWFVSNPYRPGLRYAEDRELLLRVLGHVAVGKVCEPLYFYMESGVLSLKKLVASYVAERRLIREYGPVLVGKHVTLCLWLRSLAKTLVVQLLAGFGLLGWLSRRRINGYVSLAEACSLQEEVSKILAIRLPYRK